MSVEGEYKLPRRGLATVGNKLLTVSRVVVSIAVMVALIAVVVFFNAPNPNMILVAGLVVCCAVFGLAGGLPAAVAMVGYTLYFFSTGNDFVTFTDTNMAKVVVTLIGVCVVTVFVCALKRSEDRTFSDLVHLAEVLKEDNRLLEEATTVDSLTGVKNRFGLRRDYPSYEGGDLCVAMMDVDDFKLFNDEYGHELGDKVLELIGRELEGTYGSECVYRYGGDEFLVIRNGCSPDDFESSFYQLGSRMDSAAIDGVELPVGLSVGYVFGRADWKSDLRHMLRQADEKLYQSKRDGKHRVTGAPFVRSAVAS